MIGWKRVYRFVCCSDFFFLILYIGRLFRDYLVKRSSNIFIRISLVFFSLYFQMVFFSLFYEYFIIVTIKFYNLWVDVLSSRNFEMTELEESASDWLNIRWTLRVYIFWPGINDISKSICKRIYILLMIAAICQVVVSFVSGQSFFSASVFQCKTKKKHLTSIRMARFSSLLFNALLRSWKISCIHTRTSISIRL